MKKYFRIRLFVLGTLFGVTLSILMIIATGLFILNKGVEVYLDSSSIASSVGNQVTSHAKKDLPKMIDSAKAEIPSIVKKEMEGQINSKRLEIAGLVFSVPDDLINQLESQLQDNVKKAVFSLLDGINTTDLAKDIGKTATLLVNEQIETVFHGQSFHVKIIGPLELPVTIYLDNVTKNSISVTGG